MKIKQKIITYSIIALSLVGISTVLSPQYAHAAKCGGADTAIISCKAGEESKTAKDSAVWELLIMVLNILTAGVGIAAVGGIVYGSMLYASASDRADQTKKAITIITNVVVGVIAYALMYLVLNFLIPGGIFS